jgi:hypothetical protein
MQPVIACRRRLRRRLGREILLDERLAMADNQGVWREFVTREAMEVASRAAISRWNLISRPLSFIHSEDFQIRRGGVATQLPFGMHMTTTPSVIASSDSVGTSSQSDVLLRAGPKFGVLSNSADFRVHEECPR